MRILFYEKKGGRIMTVEQESKVYTYGLKALVYYLFKIQFKVFSLIEERNDAPNSEK